VVKKHDDTKRAEAIVEKWKRRLRAAEDEYRIAAQKVLEAQCGLRNAQYELGCQEQLDIEGRA